MLIFFFINENKKKYIIYNLYIYSIGKKTAFSVWLFGKKRETLNLPLLLGIRKAYHPLLLPS